MNEKNQKDFLKVVREGDLKKAKQLLLSLDAKRDKGLLDQALRVAAFGSRNVTLFDWLLNAGANPNQVTSVGTLLMCMAMNGDLLLAKRLIQAGAELNHEVKRETALSAALSENQKPVIEYLEKLGAKGPPDTMLLYASTHGDVERMKRALRAGAEVEKTGGTFSETPLMAAARKGQLGAVELLLQNGAKPNTRIAAKTALFGAVEYGKNEKVVKALIAAGADLHAKHYDETVLMAATKGGSLPIVKRLVELGADVQARDKNFGITALDYAKQRKHKEIVAYLSGLGAKSDRDNGRALMRGLAKEFGGTVVEHSHGFTLNSKLGGNRCQFHTHAEECSVTVFNLRCSSDEFRGMTFPTIMVSPVTPEDTYNEFSKSKSSSESLGQEVYATTKAKNHAEQQALTSFCTRLKERLALTGDDCILITHDSIKLSWLETDIEIVRPKLLMLASLVQVISRPPQPERSLFSGEWLLKPAPKAMVSARHQFGGKLEQPVACPQCGGATNLMTQLDLSDPALPKTPLGRGRLPAFWCLDCLEWDAVFTDISGPVPKPFKSVGKTAKARKNKAGEEDLPERRVTVVPVAAGKKAGRKSKVGGSPTWIQMEQTPDCPKCEKPMAFVLQLASDSRISYGDMGMLYTFACPECQVCASLVQSH